MQTEFKNYNLYILKNEMQFALPHIMGWAHSTNQVLDDNNVGRDSLKVHPQASSSSSEWDR